MIPLFMLTLKVSSLWRAEKDMGTVPMKLLRFKERIIRLCENLKMEWGEKDEFKHEGKAKVGTQF